MNRIILLSCLLVCSVLGLAAQNLFTVEVGTFLDVRPQDFEAVRSLGFLHAKKLEGNLTQVYVGRFGNRAEADRLAATLRQRGFNNAAVQPVATDAGNNVALIQLATRQLDNNIDWEQLERAGNLYAIVEGNSIKILTGIFPNLDAAQAALPGVQRLGYADAFTKSVNSATLIPITTFETGLKKPLIPLTLNQQPPPAAPANTQARGVQSAPQQPQVQQRQVQEVPQSYDEPIASVMTPRSGNILVPNKASTTTTTTQPPVQTAAAATPTSAPVSYEAVRPSSASAGAGAPQIRGNVKRTSALELQKVLKEQGYYQSSLDGLYGKGTATAYEEALKKSEELRMYAVLAANLPQVDIESGDRVQRAVNTLMSDPSAPVVLEGSNTPIAQAYRAYRLFATRGPGQEVNQLMNQAIKGAYEGKKLTNRVPFDYRATYAYPSLDQLLLHLHYVHAAPGINYSIPCWLYERHPAEATQAQAAMASFPEADLKYQGCDPFLNWNDVQMLRVISRDLSAGQIDADLLAEATSRRAQLYLTREPLNAASAAAAAAWNSRLWDNLQAWAGRDPLHQKKVTALKITYHQSQARLEDYFMNQGFEAAQAKELALATLQALVGPELARFV